MDCIKLNNNNYDRTIGAISKINSATFPTHSTAQFVYMSILYHIEHEYQIQLYFFQADEYMMFIHQISKSVRDPFTS